MLLHQLDDAAAGENESLRILWPGKCIATCYIYGVIVRAQCTYINVSIHTSTHTCMCLDV